MKNTSKIQFYARESKKDKDGLVHIEMSININQKMNTTLKVVAIEAGIHKNVYSHLGRKTYGSILLNKGVRMDTVAKALGHGNAKTTATYYASLTKETVVSEIASIL